MPVAVRTLIGIDLDGTIEDSRDDMVAAVQRVRTQLGLSVRAAEGVRPHVNGGMDALYRACFDDYEPAAVDSGARWRTIREAYEADYLAHVAVATRLYPGMRVALEQLSQLGTLACITNKPERISRQLLSELGVGELFATVVGGDSCAQAKPHVVMLETAAARCQFERGQGRAFMIGDTLGDIQLARAYGATAVWCAWGYVAHAPNDPAPDHQADQPGAVPALIRHTISR
ncbi:MAG: hypothetical protein RL701_751 [Pseudomonadota bacterium]